MAQYLLAGKGGTKEEQKVKRMQLGSACRLDGTGGNGTFNWNTVSYFMAVTADNFKTRLHWDVVGQHQSR